MKILVTGGAGFIGSNLVDRLLTDGHHVVVIDDYSTGKRQNLEPAIARFHDRIDVIEADIRSKAVSAIFSDHRPACVMHLAAQIDVRKSVADPVFDAEVNIIGSLNIIEASLRNNVNRFVFTSSGGAVYAEPEELPVSESARKQPLSPYGIAKKTIDDYLEFYRHSYEMSSISLALGNVYGPRQDPLGEAGVIAIFAGRMLSGVNPVINGDGEQLRDYVFVDDVVDAFLAAMISTEKGFINIGTGQGTSVNTLYKLIADSIGFQGSAEHGPGKSGEMRRIYLECKKAHELLGWFPKTDLASGIAKTIDFFRD